MVYIKEQLINKVSKTELAKELNISRQALYQRIRSGYNEEELYKAALSIKNRTEDDKKDLRIKELEKDIEKKEEEITNLKDIIKTKPSIKYEVLLDEHKELMKKYINLRARYINQNDELIRLKLEMSKEGTNDTKGSK